MSEYKHRGLTDFSFLRFSVSDPVGYNTSCVGGPVVLDVTNESDAFETSGTTDRTQRRIP